AVEAVHEGEDVLRRRLHRDAALHDEGGGPRGDEARQCQQGDSQAQEDLLDHDVPWVKRSGAGQSVGQNGPSLKGQGAGAAAVPVAGWPSAGAGAAGGAAAAAAAAFSAMAFASASAFFFMLPSPSSKSFPIILSISMTRLMA